MQYKDTKDFYLRLCLGPKLSLDGDIEHGPLVNCGGRNKKEKETAPEEGWGIRHARSIRRCHRKDSLQTEYIWRWKAGDDKGAKASCINRTWFDILDPDSYKLTDDDDGLGVYWCEGNGCWNYKRNTHSRLQPLLQSRGDGRPCHSLR